MTRATDGTLGVGTLPQRVRRDFSGVGYDDPRDPLPRCLRDVMASNQHFSFNFDIAGAAYGLFVLGGPFANPTL